MHEPQCRQRMTGWKAVPARKKQQAGFPHNSSPTEGGPWKTWESETAKIPDGEANPKTFRRTSIINHTARNLP